MRLGILFALISAVAWGQTTTTSYTCTVASSTTALSTMTISTELPPSSSTVLVSCPIWQVFPRTATQEELIELWYRPAFEHYAPKLKPPEPKELKREVK